MFTRIRHFSIAMLVIAILSTVPAQAQVKKGDPAEHAFQATLSLNFQGSDFIFNQIAVPAGKRLVIEYVTMKVELPPGQSITDFNFVTTVNGTTVEHAFDRFEINGAGKAFTGKPVKMYADPSPLNLSVVALRSDAAGAAIINVSVSGYLIDLP